MYINRMDKDELARDILVSMTQNLLSTQINPLYEKEFIQGINNASIIAFNLADQFIKESSKRNTNNG